VAASRAESECNRSKWLVADRSILRRKPGYVTKEWIDPVTRASAQRVNGASNVIMELAETALASEGRSAIGSGAGLQVNGRVPRAAK